MGIEVCHRCDTPQCVRPDHLFLGTHQQNMADMVHKGRIPSGERHFKATLTASQVREIRARWAAGETQKHLGFEFGISAAGIYHIVHRHRWANLI